MANISQRQRLTSLDAFRGLTIAAMILVNNPGDWSHVYRPLLHAKWNGWTPTDWIFPFFLFIMGVAMALSLRVRIETVANKAAVWLKVFKRTLLLFGLGLVLSAFRDYSVSLARLLVIIAVLIVLGSFVLLYLRLRIADPGEREAAARLVINSAMPFVIIGVILAGLYSYNFATVRIPGVLQRIALCYLAVSAMMVLLPRARDQWITMGALILLYLVIMYGLYVPEHGRAVWTPQGHASGYIDRLVFGLKHLWSGTRDSGYDPEGVVTTLPAILSVFLGLQFGKVLVRVHDHKERLFQWLALGAFLTVLGLTLDFLIPINKQLWTPTYSIFMAGFGGLLLAGCYWLIEIKGRKNWAQPFVMLGMNPLFIFWLSGFLVRNMFLNNVGHTNLRNWLYVNGYTSWLGETNIASLAFALSNVIFWLLVAWFMYRRRWFIKI
ncbi:MAG: acyltransferase family protein [Candidatus Neomarinimicrobiota bacterium]